MSGGSFGDLHGIIGLEGEFEDILALDKSLLVLDIVLKTGDFFHGAYILRINLCFK